MVDLPNERFIMKKIFGLLFLTFISCGKSADAPKGSTLTKLPELEAKIKTIEPWLPYCQYTSAFRGMSKDTCLIDKNGSGDADTMAYAGYSCLAGVQEGCETAKRSFSETTGRGWRSPGRVDNDIGNEFSRDMLLGALSYFAATKDVDRAYKFQTWLESNDNVLCFAESACDMRETSWALMGEVWRYIGLPLNLRMRIGMQTDELTQQISANINKVGYRLNLIGMTILIRQKIGTYNTQLANAAIVLTQRQPNNLFFQYLVYGKSDSLIERALQQIPNSQPEHRDTWVFDVDQDENKDSMGWDWLFFYNLMKN